MIEITQAWKLRVLETVLKTSGRDYVHVETGTVYRGFEAEKDGAKAALFIQPCPLTAGAHVAHDGRTWRIQMTACEDEDRLLLRALLADVTPSP